MIMNGTSSFKNNSGLTLIETIFAVAVSLILITAVVSLYTSYTKNTRGINMEIAAEQDGRVALEYVITEILSTGRNVAKAKSPIVTANHNKYEFKYASVDFTDPDIDKYIKVTYSSNYPSGFTSLGELKREIKACSTEDFTLCLGTAIDGSTYDESKVLIESLALNEGGSDPKSFTFEYFDKDGLSLNPGQTDVISTDLTKIKYVKVKIIVSTKSEVWSASEGIEKYKTFEHLRQVKLRTLEKY